jgi:hypothetical protein
MTVLDAITCLTGKLLGICINIDLVLVDADCSEEEIALHTWIASNH